MSLIAAFENKVTNLKANIQFKRRNVESEALKNSWFITKPECKNIQAYHLNDENIFSKQNILKTIWKEFEKSGIFRSWRVEARFIIQKFLCRDRTLKQVN